MPRSSIYFYDHETRVKDVAKGKELMAKAGYPDGFSFTIKTAMPQAHHTNAALLLQAQLAQESAARDISIEVIQRTVADAFGVTIADLLGRRRTRNIAEPRMVAMYLAREFTGRSTSEIGAAFARDHATILHAGSQVPKLCGTDEKFRRTVAQIRRQLKKN